MNSTTVAIALALAGLGVFWPSLKGLVGKAWGVVSQATTKEGGGPISRDAAVAGLLTAVDYAHAEGKHDVCDALNACLPGLIGYKEHATK